MTIGEVATLAGVPPATVRYYEKRGLIGAAPRSRSGYRQYGPEATHRLRFIRRAKQLGFSLDEIHEMLGLRVSDPASCIQVAATAEEKLRGIRQRLMELERMKRTLERLVRSCRAKRTTVECPILGVLTERVDA